MGRAASDYGPEDYIVVVPHAWRDDDLWRDIQTETQQRIGRTLCKMYAEFLQRPLSPDLERIARRIEVGSETRPHAC